MKKIKLEDLKVGMTVDVCEPGAEVGFERGVIIEIDGDEVMLVDGSEGFGVDATEVEFAEVEH